METVTTKKTSPATLALFAAAVAFATFLVYLPSARYGFVSFDDLRYVPGNTAIRSIDAAFIKLIFTTVIASNWHPLTIFSYALDYSLWGNAPSGYHIENIVWHSANAALVFFLAVRLFAARGFKGAGAAYAALSAALVFGLHPTHVESVSWVSERKDVLSGFFFILSVLAYLGYAGPAPGKKPLYYLASLLCFVLAALAKPMAVTLPVVLLLLDYYPLERIRTGPVKVFAEKVPFFAVSLLVSALTLWAQSYGGAIKAVSTFSLSKRVFLSVKAPVFYIWKTLWPFKLSPIYMPPVDTSLASAGFVLSLAFVLAVTAFCLYAARKNRSYLAAWLYFIVTLLPVIGIIQVGDQAAADRYTYLPSLGPVLLAAAGARSVFTRLKGPGTRALAAAFLLLLSTLLAARTVSQQSVWKDSVSLWTHVLEVEGEVPLAYNSRGLVYQEMGDHQKAIADFNRAIELDPGYAFPYNNRGYSYQKMNDREKAQRDYDKAIELNPKIANPYNNRGLLYYDHDEFEKAVRDFRKAIELDPKLLNSYMNLGLAYMELGRFTEALGAFDAGLRLSPTQPDLLVNRGFLYMTLDEYAKAAADFEAAAKYNPDDPSAHWGLGLASLRLGDKKRAGVELRKAASLGSVEAEEFLSRAPELRE